MCIYRWADQCTSGHDKNRLTAKFKTFPFVGQNYAQRWQTGSADDVNRLQDLVNGWYDEVKGLLSNQSSAFRMDKEVFK